MMRMGLGLMVVALAGCSLFKATPANPTPAQTAAAVGSNVGTAACAAAIHKDPSLATRLATASAKGKAVLGAPDPTLAGLNEALATVGGDAGFYASLGVPALVASLTAAGVDVQSLEPGSPLATGLGALFDACAAIAGGVA